MLKLDANCHKDNLHELRKMQITIYEDVACSKLDKN